MQKIRKGDTAIMIVGKDKGRVAQVKQLILPDHALLEDINVVKKHKRPQSNQPGVIHQEAKVHLSNLAFYDAPNKKAGRIGFKFLEDGRKVRYLKGSGEIVDL